MRSPLVFVCCLLVFSAVGVSRQLTGTVYSDHSGPSAQGTGYVSLATSSGMVRIHYQKPIESRFSDNKCRQLGAIWIVWTERVDDEEELIRAQCNGAVEEPVHSAWRAALAYISMTARAAGHELGFQLSRRGPIFVTMSGVKVEVSGYLQFPGNGMCLEMKERVNSSTVIIATSADCYFYPDIDLTVEHISPSVWGVTRVEAFDKVR